MRPSTWEQIAGRHGYSDEREMWVDLHREHAFTVMGLARLLGIPASTIRFRLRKTGVGVVTSSGAVDVVGRVRYSKARDAHWEDLAWEQGAGSEVEMWRAFKKSGKTGWEIAGILGCSQATVSARMRRYRIKIGRGRNRRR